MHFIKYHGLGNDFVLLEETALTTPAIGAREAIAICARGAGVGADGVMRARASDTAHLAMELLNADGTTPEMCGNGLRCLVKYAVEEMGLRANPLDVDTVAGLRRCSYTLDEEGVVSTVRVEMGPTIVEPSKVDEYEGWAVDVGNPHFVLLDDPAAADRRRAERVGAQLTSHERFPEGANIEFVDVIDATHLRVVVYERGCGLTQACGTGATAAVAAAVHSGRCEADSDIRVSLPGGDLSIRISASSAQSWMEGPASEVYRGTMSSAP